jgi:hypothetical protein
VVSCERTVRAGGASRHAGMKEPDTGDQILNKKSCGNQPRKISGRAQDTTRGGVRDRMQYSNTKNLACLWQISRY